MKPLPWILAAATALVVLVGVWFLLDETAQDDGDATRITGTWDTPAADDGAPGSDASGPTALATPPPALDTDDVAATDESDIPESYRRALGGIIGRVVESTGEPVPDLRIQLVGGGPNTVEIAQDAILAKEPGLDVVLGDETTDAEGRFHFAELETRLVGVLVLDPGGPRAMMHILQETPVGGEVRDIGDIVLPRTITLTGVVVDERDEPVAGARVRATELPAIVVGSGVADYRPPGGVVVHIGDEVEGEPPLVVIPPESLTRLERLLPIPTTFTDDEGRFVVDGVRPGLISVVVDDEQYMTLVHGPVPSGEPGGTRDVGELRLPDGFTLLGKVVDDKGEPVPGAEVLAGNRLVLGPVTILRGPFVADAEGRFSVPGLRPAVAHAVARRDEHRDFSVSEAVTPGVDEATVVIPSTRKLTLSVVDPDGSKIGGARFLGRSVPGPTSDIPDFILTPRPLDDVVTRDDEDRYVLEELDPTSWEIVVHAPGYGIARETFDMAWDDRRETVTLDPGRSLKVTVVRQEDEEPVEWAKVIAYEEDFGMGLPVTSARTDENGVARLRDLPTGTYALEVTHPSLAVAGEEVTVPEVEEVTIALQPGGSIAGTVVDQGGPPPEPLLVVMTTLDNQPTSAEIPRMTITRLDGTFAFDRVEEGEVRLEARERIDMSSLTGWWEPFAMTPLAEERVHVTTGQETEAYLVVGNTYDGIETGFVEGRLFVNGYPASNWKVRTWGAIRRSVTTAADGSFNMGRLAAGEVRLLFSPASMSMMEGGYVDAHELELAAEAREYVDVSISTGGVFGRVVSEIDGRPIEGAAVRVATAEAKEGWFGRRAGTITVRDGSYRLDTVAEGRYTVSAEADGYGRIQSPPFTVDGLGTLQVPELRLPSALVVSGRVELQGAAEPPEWMWLMGESAEGVEVATRVDAEDGSFTFDDLSPGTWEFVVNTSMDGEFEPVTVVVVSELEDLRLSFPPFVEEDVVVSDEDEETVVVDDESQG